MVMEVKYTYSLLIFPRNFSDSIVLLHTDEIPYVYKTKHIDNLSFFLFCA